MERCIDHSLVLHEVSHQTGSVTIRDSCLAALVATVWGFNFVVIDWGMDGVPPLLFVAIRFTVVLFPAIFFVRRPDAPWRTVLGVGAFMSLGQFGLLYVAMDAGMPPGLAALVLQAQVIFTLVIASGWLRELPTSAQLAGALVGTAGLGIVAAGRGGHGSVTALVVCLLAALSWGIGNVISRSSGDHRRPGADGVVGPRRTGAAVRLLDRPGRTVDRRHGADVVHLAGLGLDVVHRRPGVPGGVRHLQHPAVPLPLVVGRAVGPAGAGRRRCSRPRLLLHQQPNGREVLGGALLIVGVLITLRPARAGVPDPQVEVGQGAGRAVDTLAG